MIGRTIESRVPFPWGPAVFGAAAVALAAAGPAFSLPHLAVGAVLPLALAVVAWLRRPLPFSMRVAEDGIETAGEHRPVPFRDFEGLLVDGGSGSRAKLSRRPLPLTLLHRAGVVEIPARLDVRSDELYEFLLSRFPPGGARDVPASLLDHLREQEREFGPERVWTYCRRRHLGFRAPRRVIGTLGLGMVAAGAAWLFVPLAGPRYEDWLVAGIFTLLFGGLFWLLSLVTYRPLPKDVKRPGEAGLVISPLGLALVQGELRGRMRWDELRDIRFEPAGRHFRVGGGTHLAGIQLHFEGAVVAVADIYDRPLPLIHDRLREYWR